MADDDLTPQEILESILQGYRRLGWCSDAIRNDWSVVLPVVQRDGHALQEASDALRADFSMVTAAVKQNGLALHHHGLITKHDLKSPEYAAFIREFKKVVLEAVMQNGNALQFAGVLRMDKEVVLAAVKSRPSALKFAQSPVDVQDPDLLRAAGLLRDGDSGSSRTERALLSVRFGLAESSSPFSTIVHVEMSNDPYLGKFSLYNPNAFCKGFCGPDDMFTDKAWPCRGNLQTCEQPATDSDGKPTNQSCWRFSFGDHQRGSKESGGFMVQVWEVDPETGETALGKGQEIEDEMALDMGLKVFPVYQTSRDSLDFKGLKLLKQQVQEYYGDNAGDLEGETWWSSQLEAWLLSDRERSFEAACVTFRCSDEWPYASAPESHAGGDDEAWDMLFREHTNHSGFSFTDEAHNWKQLIQHLNGFSDVRRGVDYPLWVGGFKYTVVAAYDNDEGHIDDDRVIIAMGIRLLNKNYMVCVGACKSLLVTALATTCGSKDDAQRRSMAVYDFLNYMRWQGY